MGGVKNYNKNKNNKHQCHRNCNISLLSVHTKSLNFFIVAAFLLTSTCLLTLCLPHAYAAPSYNTLYNKNNINSYNSHNKSKNASLPSTSSSQKATRASVWPPMQHLDIWSDVETTKKPKQPPLYDRADVDTLHYFGPSAIEWADMNSENRNHLEYVTSNFVGDNKSDKVNYNNTLISDTNARKRQSKVIHLFPIPVDGECLSDDGRRTGTCFNAYECRAKGGTAKGECAMGFGVCCIFMANCNTTISNNITYLVSPQFPSFLPHNLSVPCNFKIEMMSNEISQLRLDFFHFSLGQPNRRNGVCEGDVFNISGGPAGVLSLCGQNSGQHIYYDVGSVNAPRQTLYGNLRPLTYSQLYPNASRMAGNPIVEISMSFGQRLLPTRLWEIRIAQIPFSQRAPVGCLQYYTGTEGIIQTFNFADNGRHLANQHYRICMRQEAEMCSIIYQPCDEQSFRIGPGAGNANEPMANMMLMNPAMMNPSMNGNMGALLTNNMAGVSTTNPQLMESTPMMGPTVLADDVGMQQMMGSTSEATVASSTTTSTTATTTTETTTTTTTATAAPETSSSTAAAATSESSAAESTASSITSTAATTSASSNSGSVSNDPTEASQPASSSSGSTLDTRSSTTPAPSSSTPLNDDIEEGSGDGAEITPTRRPRPVRGGFDLLGFLRSAFDLASLRSQRRASRQLDYRQFFSRCSDRLTMPCIIEDFIGMGPLATALPGCEPVHCGASFCASGVWPCQVESTVTPFYIGVHFGNGAGKGSAEDNIGACLRYAQVQCV